MENRKIEIEEKQQISREIETLKIENGQLRNGGSVVMLNNNNIENGDQATTNSTNIPERRVIKSFLKQSLSVDKIGGPTKALIPLRSGGLLFESYADRQRKKIAEILQKDNRIQYRESKNIDPVLEFCGIEKCYIQRRGISKGDF